MTHCDRCNRDEIQLRREGHGPSCMPRDYSQYLHALNRLLEEDLWKSDLIHSAADKRIAVIAAKAAMGDEAALRRLEQHESLT